MTAPIRVAYLLNSFPATSETFVINEIEEAIRQGVVVRVFSLHRPEIPCPHKAAQKLALIVEYLSLNPDRRLLRTWLLHLMFLLSSPTAYTKAFWYALRHNDDAMLWAFKVSVHYAHALRQFRPTWIHTHFAYSNSRFAMLVSMLLGVPYTFTIHGWHDLYKSPPKYLRDVIVNSERTVTVCKYNKEYLISTYGISSSKVVVIYCGIPLERFYGNGAPAMEGLIISVGRLHYHKAYHNLVSACRLLADRHVDFRCWIVGEGTLREELQDQIARENLMDKVVLLGAKDYEEVPSLIKRGQVFVLPSEVEVMGLATAEAMAAGLPVVSSAVFGVPELVEHGVSGYLCEPNQPDRIAEYLAVLLSDAELRKKMGRKGREKVAAQHDLPSQVGKLISLWRGDVGACRSF